MKKVGVWLAVAMVGVWVGQARADDPKPEKQVTDAQFVQQASAAGLAEVNAALLVPTRAKSDDVKKFAQKMKEDHTKANEQLIAVANKLQMRVAQTEDAAHQAIGTRLSGLRGEAFDKAYMKQQVKDHEEAVALFEAASKSCKNKDLKSLAEKTLPKLKDHLKMAKDVCEKTEKGDKTASK